MTRLGAGLCAAALLALLVGVNPALAAPPPQRVPETFELAAATAQGRVGVAAVLLETGETVSLNDGDAFPMQSVYKFPIAMAVLDAIAAGKLRLDQRIRVAPSDMLSARQHSPIRDRHPDGVELTVEALLEAMVRESDGTACDVLLRVLGGPSIANAYLRATGLGDITIATTEREMGEDEQAQYRNSATPAGMVALLVRLHRGQGITPDHRTRLLRWMTETATGKNRLRAGLPSGTPLAHKTGTDRTVDGLTRATNDVGLITMPDGRHLVIAVFVADSTADEATREAMIAACARIAWRHWVPPPASTGPASPSSP